MGTEMENSSNTAVAEMTSQDELQQGISAARAGEREKAYAVFQRAVEEQPTNSEAWVWLGSTSADLGEAESAFARAYNLDPNNEEAALGLRWVRLRRSENLPDFAGADVPAPSGQGSVALPTMAPVTSVKCPNCGADNKIDEKFCVNCGQDLREAAAQATSSSQSSSLTTSTGGARWSVVILVVLILIALAGMAYWYFVVSG